MKITAFFVSLLLSFSLSAATLRGIVKDGEGVPVAEASVAIDGVRRTATADDGTFTLELPDGTYALRVSRPGFAPWQRSVAAGESVELSLQPAFVESMTVAGIRADAETPVTKSDITHDEIEQRYYGQDVPALLRDAPSINTYTESGVGGSGYSYITLRGIGSSRINFTLDGVPLADSEDMATYFADFPDLARSLQSVQIQRGVGTSTVGSPSFGGSVNLQSIDLAAEQHIDATLGGGSFGNRQATVGYQSGALRNGLSIYSRLSFQESDGYRDNSGIEQHNLFLSASKPIGEGLLKLTGFSGYEEQQLSWSATDLETLLVAPRTNPLRPEEKDAFGYDLAQLQYIRPLDNATDMTASVYYQRGYGSYTLFDYGTDLLRDYGLDGVLFGTMLTLEKRSGALTTQYGLHLNRFKRDHTRDDIAAGTRDYANYGVKQEANAFAKANWDSGRWHLYGDAQVRTTSFDYHGDVDIDSVRWTFFNPKVGARYELSPRNSVYGSFGISTREPARNDLFLGQDNPTVAHDLRAIRPERVHDFESGWNYQAPNFSLAANFYAMEFRNEIAATGELSEIGLPLRQNVDRSHRRGIELEALWQASPMLRLRTSANLSRNRIDEWTQFYDVYDESGAWIDAKAVIHRNVNPVLTPDTIVNQSVEYSPSRRFNATATGRWIGESYLDNTNNDDFTAPSFFLLDANFSIGITDWARIAVHVNNVLDNDRVWPSGYSYLYYTRDNSGAETLGGTPYYYPQAGRNAVVLLELGF